MRPFTTLLPFHAALEIVRGVAVPVRSTERLPLVTAVGRVLAEAVNAPLNVPPFDRAAMDGYGVIAEDTASAADLSPTTLGLSGRVHAGEVFPGSVERGGCVEIATGAPMPRGADAVVMVEHTTRDGNTVNVFRAVRAGQHVARAGSDIGSGQIVALPGDELTPARIGALCAVGVAEVAVYRRPSVALVATGNELTPPGLALEAGRIYETNAATLAGVVTQHGGLAASLGIVPDTVPALDAALTRALQHDLVVFTGGSSVGERDYLIDAISSRARVLFHGIAVRPGKPTLFAAAGATPIFGMPGNPTSCLSNAYLLLVPLLRATARLPPWRPERLTLPLARRIVSPADRHQFYTVRIINGTAEPAFKSSSDTTSMAGADGFIEIPAGADGLEAGTLVTVVRF
jgi:molybdenum cofactor synthesis domain-containing protein